jgi:dipeptidyl-peptidase-4
MRFKRLLLVGLAVALAAPAAAQVPQLTVDNIYSSREFSGDLVSLRWMDDGEHFTRIERGENGVTDLYRVNARTGIEQLAVVGADLVPPGADEPIRIERYTFSPDGTKLLIFTNEARIPDVRQILARRALRCLRA